MVQFGFYSASVRGQTGSARFDSVGPSQLSVRVSGSGQQVKAGQTLALVRVSVRVRDSVRSTRSTESTQSAQRVNSVDSVNSVNGSTRRAVAFQS
ncbi:hypothetical protein Hdeb2414_s0120g00802841 [Helianthus debilis subsp. tardiflorus]